MKQFRQFFFRMILCWACCLPVATASLTVIYPDMKPPYDTVFKHINEGIAEEFNGKISYIKLDDNDNLEQVANKVDSNNVIALGRKGLTVAKQLNQSKTVLVGALPIKPNGVAGVSLTASPTALFESLNQLAPEINTVYVLYSTASAWIMEQAKNDALTYNLKLVLIEVNDLRTAVEKYDQIFDKQDLSHSAIWLPLDSITAHEKVVVPNILEKAWNHKMVVFSSKPIHAKRGALFSAMPNNKSMGQQLAQMLNNFNKQQVPSDVKPMNAIKLAVNLRTAAHLGISYDNSTKSSFDVTFPK